MGGDGVTAFGSSCCRVGGRMLVKHLAHSSRHSGKWFWLAESVGSHLEAMNGAVREMPDRMPAVEVDWRCMGKSEEQEQGPFLVSLILSIVGVLLLGLNIFDIGQLMQICV